MKNKRYDIEGKKVRVNDKVWILLPHYRNFIEATILDITSEGFVVSYFCEIYKNRIPTKKEKETTVSEVLKCKKRRLA